jgi:hypothetical protein
MLTGQQISPEPEKIEDLKVVIRRFYIMERKPSKISTKLNQTKISISY